MPPKETPGENQPNISGGEQPQSGYFEQLGPERRTSPIRRIFGPILHGLVERLHTQFPKLTADHISAMSAVGGAIGAVLAERQSEKLTTETPTVTSLIPLTFLASGAALDGLDGALAREIASKDPSKSDLVRGATVDSIADYVKEVSMGVSKIVSANRRNNPAGEAVAYLATLSSPVSSLLRARTEAGGQAVPELGNNILEFFGTRTGRTICNILATVYPQFKDIPIQTFLDALVLTGNCMNIMRNASIPDIPLGEETVSERGRTTARGRVKFHSLAFVATLGIALATYTGLRMEKQTN